MKHVLQALFVGAALFPAGINAQTTITLQPGAEGKDAFVDSRLHTSNAGNHPDIASIAWTNSGTPTNCRSFFAFDYSSIPAGAVIQSAYLTLYAYNSAINGSNSTMDGPNTTFLRRVTGSWTESTLTWDNQPATTTAGQLTIASAATITNADNMNVTALVQAMIANGNNGFMIQLETESYYRRQIYASGDNTNAALHPKLVVTYTSTLGLTENESASASFTLFPNPSNGIVHMVFAGENGISRVISVWSVNGQLMQQLTAMETAVEADLSTLAPGVYFVRVEQESGTAVQQLIIQ